MSDFDKWINKFITPGQPQAILPGRHVHLGVQATPVGLTAQQAMTMAARLIDCAHNHGEPVMRFADDREPTTNERHLMNLISWRQKEAAEAKENLAIQGEQLNVATARAQRFRDCLMRLAARADDYSSADIRAHVADALEMTIQDLIAILEAS